MKNRRDILRNAGAVSLAAGAGPLLQACASAPSAPEPPPKQVALLGMLPVGPKVVAPGHGPRMTADLGSLEIVPGRPPSNRNEVVGFVAALIGIVIVGSVIGAVRGADWGTESKIQPLGVDVVAMLNERLLTQLRARHLSVLSMADPTLARQARGGNTKAVPPEVDGILDVTVVEAFYATSWRSSGYSPTINVLGVVTDPRAEMDEVMGYTYYADNRDWGKQRRQFTMPENLTFARASDIRANAGLVQEGLERVLNRIVELIVDDVHRHCTGQAPI
jgi:hypothetical protein